MTAGHGHPDGTGGGPPDPGLAEERTRLAWTRTAISCAALGAAVLKSSPVTGALVLAASSLVWLAGRLAGRPAGARGGDRRRLLAAITAVVATLSAGALALALLSGHHVPALLGRHRLLP